MTIRRKRRAGPSGPACFCYVDEIEGPPSPILQVTEVLFMCKNKEQTEEQTAPEEEIRVYFGDEHTHSGLLEE